MTATGTVGGGRGRAALLWPKTLTTDSLFAIEGSRGMISSTCRGVGWSGQNIDWCWCQARWTNPELNAQNGVQIAIVNR